MKKLPDQIKPQDIDAWEEEISTVRQLSRPEEKPAAPLVLDEVSPSLRMEGVYNANSFRPLVVGNTDYLDRATADKFRSGRFKIEARLDLHGRTEKEAFAAVTDFIRSSFGQNRRCVLIITGKGTRKEDDAWYEAKGIIRDALPKWLNHPDIRPFILSMVQALPADGGSGAFYVLLKRQRGLNKPQKF